MKNNARLRQGRPLADFAIDSNGGRFEKVQNALHFLFVVAVKRASFLEKRSLGEFAQQTQLRNEMSRNEHIVRSFKRKLQSIGEFWSKTRD